MNLEKEIQARDWCFTVNNPKLTEQAMYDYLKSVNHVRYYLFVREKGKHGTEHHQGYIEFTQPKKFSTVKNIFSEEQIGVNAYISKRKYDKVNCVNYVKKIGKFADKADTHISEVYEYGEFCQGGTRTDLTDLVDMCRNGADETELYEYNAGSYAHNHKFIHYMAYMYKAAPFKRKYRQVEVYYVYGPTRTGKTRSVYDEYGYENVYCNQGYDHGKWFDDYAGQDVLLPDEFDSSIDFSLLLQYLDGHPICIPCRYKNKWACYTKVYIVSNLGLEKQYQIEQMEQPERWKALLARIKCVRLFDELSIYFDFTTEEYLKLADGKNKFEIMQMKKEKSRKEREEREKQKLRE